jgi:hypothetical protein
MLDVSVSQTGIRKGVLGVPKDENAKRQKNFVGVPKFSSTK